jgi:Zn finger protein HypA/HybF involved in hydrogenase expression
MSPIAEAVATVVGSFTVVVIASLAFAARIHARMIADDQDAEMKTFPYQHPAHDCMICGQSKTMMGIEGFKAGFLHYSCPKCKAVYRTHPKTK